jgi:hypothetical protein
MKSSQARLVSLLSAVGVAAVFSLVGAVGLMPAPAFAQGTPEQQQACQSDAFRLCNEFIPDVPKVTACMARKRASLSPACRGQFAHPSSRGIKLKKRHH